MPAKRKGPETSEAAPKRAPTPRQAKVGTSDSGAYTTASKYVKDVHLHNSLDEPITTDFKLTHQLSES
jgi:hypothetical protein